MNNLYFSASDSWADLKARVPAASVSEAGGICPFQAEGMLDTREFYFRYRSGIASLSVGEENASKPMTSRGQFYASKAYGGSLGGSLHREEFIELFSTLVQELEPAPFLWKFQGVGVKSFRSDDGALIFEATGEPEIYCAWGLTAIEAFDAFHSYDEGLESFGVDRKAQVELARLKALKPEPLNHYEQKASPAPYFKVNNV